VLIEEAGKSLVANYGLSGCLIALTVALIWLLLKWFMTQIEVMRAENLVTRQTERKENAEARAEDRREFLEALKDITARHEMTTDRTEQRWAKANAAMCVRIERLEETVAGKSHHKPAEPDA